MQAESTEAPQFEISPDDQASLEASLPMLFAIRDEDKVATVTLPHDLEAFPDTPVSLAPFYMNHGDPLELGQWQLTLGAVEFRLASTPTPNDGHPNFKLRKLTPEPLSSQEMHDVVTVLSHLNEQWKQYTETPQQPISAN